MINGTGIFSLLFNWVQDKAQNIKIRADRMMQQEQDIADAINAQVDRAGKKSMIAPLNMAINQINNLAAGSVASDAATFGQLMTQINQILAKNASNTNPGFISLATLAEAIAGVNNDKAITPYTFRNGLEQLQAALSSSNIPAKYFYGFDLDGTIAGFNFSAAPGGTYDTGGNQPMVLNASMTKFLNSQWSAGSGGGARPSNMGSLTGSVHLFVIGQPNQPATAGILTTADLSGNLVNLQAVANGSLRMIINNIEQQVDNIDLSGVQTIADVAGILNDLMPLLTITASGNVINMTTKISGANANVQMVAASGAAVDLSAPALLNRAGATSINGTDTQLGAVDLGADTDRNAANLMSSSGAPYAAGYRYKQYIGTANLDGSGQIVNITPFANGDVPVGTMIMNQIAFLDGYVLMGSTLSRTTYRRLFLATNGVPGWGTGDGSTTFVVPDMANRAPYGAGADLARGATTNGKLPNITGGFQHSADSNNEIVAYSFINPYGAFTTSDTVWTAFRLDWLSGNFSNVRSQLNFSAQASNPIYQTTPRAVPSALGVSFWFKT